jgi:chromate reductase
MGVLAISGSLRAESSNLRLLQTAAKLTALIIYDELSALPLFNPDDDDKPPEVVRRFRDAVRAADALLFSTPEYAHGVPGALKNALDWLVSAEGPIRKRAAVWNAASRVNYFAQPQLIEILRTMNLRVVMDAARLGLKLTTPLQRS